MASGRPSTERVHSRVAYITTAEVLYLLSTFAPLAAAVASWRVACHLTRSWKSERVANTYNRLVREPMKVAQARYDEGIRSLTENGVSEEKLVAALIRLSHRYMATVRNLRSAQAIDLSSVAEGLEIILENCEDALNYHFAVGHCDNLLMVKKLDSILESHESQLTDFIEQCDPSRPRSPRKVIAPSVAPKLPSP